MKTFSEIQNEKPFNWFEELNKEDKNWFKLQQKAAKWVTCACGNLCSTIPRDFDGEPLDQILSNLGYQFYKAIITRNCELALNILFDIESRSAELLKNIK